MIISYSIFLICAVFQLTANGLKRKSTNGIKDVELDTDQLIRKNNYPVETHFITTEDNYILCLHRIPNPNGKPILLQHGLLDSSASYILMGPRHSFGYYLYDMGYDVWMGNARGNHYSRNHTKLNPDSDDQFWNFSWHEIAIYDIPAMIDYILQATNTKKLFYVGHSQGTTAFFVLCSMRPEYNEKFILAHAMAPVAFVKHVRTPLLTYGKNYIQKPSTKSKLEFMPNSDKFKALCLGMKDTCLNVFFMIMGRDMEQFNKTTLPMIVDHIPAGCALKQVLHYAQLQESDKFCRYDYGKDNQQMYGQDMPPDYELEKVTAPLALHYGLNDFLCEPEDVQRLITKLPKAVRVNQIKFAKWNHMDFLYAIEARDMLYEYVHELNKEFS